ncbi:hypothetical protein EK21DRAFT_56912 [Setomelanomma holmii]|uniref:Uncharacterized protein n=1 Tax=Setomelanomma holmii TaxID=210430 RepID=A0A9P4HHJ5_9PLEO|nr:hypothetical protein EK21DRAFT_56912 [Setomelanomma holmii]
MSSPLAKNNAFGIGSPSWNLAFPSGNLTAGEILAYLPHWLKSVDVIDRFITNGGKSLTIAAMINEFRYLPGDGDTVFRPNSAQIMMSYGMRRAGYRDWTVGSHPQFARPNPNLTETDLDVRTFRTPRETHPKSAPAGLDGKHLRHNEEADPVEFKNLAQHVKTHPSGSDALDLARCVLYALAHKDEQWYFPDDFEALVKKLGGPAAVTHSHLDRQAFGRRNDYAFVSPTKSTPRPQSATLNSGSPLKRMMDTEGTITVASRRKSGRLAKKTSVNLRQHDSDATDVSDSPRSGYSTPAKRRKLNRIPPTPGSPSNDSDFVGDGSEPDDEIPAAEDISDDEPISPVNAARGRAAARKARQNIRSFSTETQRNIEALTKQKQKQKQFISPTKTFQVAPLPSRPIAEISPEMMSLARTFSTRKPVFLQPPQLSANRLRVDWTTIYVYAAEGFTSTQEMWTSALSSTRYNGPRQHPPFRELHRLTDPPATDASDWAENIRWAKEQYKFFGSETWTEYDYHLGLITEHRREVYWVSEEAIMHAR